MDTDVGKYTDMAVGLGMAYAPKFILAITTLIVGFWLVNRAVRILDKALRVKKVDPSLAGFLESLMGILLKAMVLISVATMVGVQMTSFVALIGAAGLAIGLSLQGSLSNFAGGVLILLFKPFVVGDYISTVGVEGSVKRIDIIYTTLGTPDNKTVVIPNGQISNDTVTNFSTWETRRLDMVFGISYNDDIEKAKTVLNKLVESEERILKDPEPLIAVLGLGESSVDIVVRVFLQNSDYWPVHFAFHEAVKKTFDTEGVSFPFPTREVLVTNKG